MSSSEAETRALRVREGIREHERGRAASRYERLEEIGRGGMATVHRARDRQLNRFVALKILLPQALPHDAAVQRFRREAETHGRLSHPNIVTVHDVGEEEGRPFLVMELVPGRSLAQILPAKPHELRPLLGLLIKVARAVQYAHEKGIVHRDLKPSNILVSEPWEPKVADFGLAHLLDPDDALTKTGSALGTPLYMAPEQVAARSGQITPRTDVYAIGVILYEILTGAPPHRGSTPMEIFSGILGEEPVPPRRADPKIHPDLETICLKALEKEPDRRYASAWELAEDLRRHLAGEPIEAKPPSLQSRLARKVRKHRTAAVAAAVAIAALAAWWGWTALSRARAFERHRDEARRANAEGRWGEALTRSEDALRIRKDEELERIRAASRDHLDRDRRLREGKIRPLWSRIENVRPLFYDRDADIRAQLDGLRSALEDLAAETTTIPEAWVVLGVGWHLLGEDARAESALRRAPDDARVSRTLARIYLDRSLLAWLGSGDESKESRKARARVWQEMALDQLRGLAALELDGAIVDAYRALARESFSQAARICDEGLARFAGKRGSDDFHVLRGWATEGKERIDAATRAIDEKPHNAAAYLLRGCAYWQEQDRERAKADFTAALRIHPRLELALRMRALVGYELGDFEGAFADYDAALRADPRSADAVYGRGLARAARGDRDGAIADYTEAIRLQPDHERALVNRGLEHDAAGRRDDAMRDLAEAVHVAPRSVPAWYNRGLLHQKAGRLEEAISDYSAAIGIDRDCSRAYLNRGAAHAQAGDLKSAVADWTEVVRVEPRHLTALYNRGRARGRLGDEPGMLDDYAAALRAAPADWPHRGQVESILRAAGRSP